MTTTPSAAHALPLGYEPQCIGIARALYDYEGLMVIDETTSPQW